MKSCKTDVGEKLYSRKEMLKITGKSIAGVALATTLPTLMTGCAEKKAELPSKEVLNYEYKEASTEAAPHPYEYQKLDAATVTERGHASYYNIGNCCRGAADAIIGELADNTGYPFNQIPIDMFANGGGGYGAGTLCGALGGAVAAIGLVCEPEDAQEITKELFAWYTSTELPTYQPDIQFDKSVSPSVNCVDSVSEFMEVSGFAHGDPERKERCACITGEVAGKTVELLNKHFGL